ncbi:uncharacterized protein LY89DRAFT_699975 [Mollisia scopiformis]|uniref:Glycosyl transferase family 1 domain-containing protein n=1 Tax=Mollisia scopiformis TaxID=149040 RepID=A0A194WVK8_MOLSC|nr:uncharacterized protein LY89DRAFT_699975 [Mollisia scopiformis]KUJ12001.1 hypothetical protein LY89DRAFT_699975 [Mollisia scopiformis]
MPITPESVVGRDTLNGTTLSSIIQEFGTDMAAVDIAMKVNSSRGPRRSIAKALPSSCAPLLPGIIILNQRYFPDSEFSAAKVGATSFAFSAMSVLQEARLFAGMILYKRDESITTPRLLTHMKSSIPCVTLFFNFLMDWMSIRDALNEATESLTFASYGTKIKAILYHQTDTLLAYNPEWLPSCVTHHGPFCDDFANHFSTEEAAIAFGSCEKAQHLKTFQRIGLRHLRSAKNMFVLQHSSVQRNYLLRHNVEASRIQKLSPPINIESLPRLPLASTHPKIVEFMHAKPSLLLFTAVARIDFFKNIELFVDASVELVGRGRAVRVLIAGDDEADNSRRQELTDRVPSGIRSEFMVIPKLSKDCLYSLFDQVADKGVFVCTSRYETLGITPLEASLSGVPTVIANSLNVEASTYYPEEYRFENSITALAGLVEAFLDSGMKGRGCYLRKRIEEHISHDKFRKSMMEAWRVFSLAACGNEHGKHNEPSVGIRKDAAVIDVQVVA